jgi:hypothetical protein
LEKLTRKVGALKAAITEMKMKGKHPWADDVDVEKRLKSTDLKDMTLGSGALNASTLEPIHICR